MAHNVLRKYVFVVAYFLLAITIAGALAVRDVSAERPSLFIVPRLDGTVSAFEAFTGKPLWNFSTGGHLLQSSEPSVTSAEVSIFNAIQREGLQDAPDKSSILGATPFMSTDGTIFLTHKSSKLFALDPSTGNVISSNVMDTSSGETPLFTEGPVCKTSLHIVRTEHTLETHNDTAMRFLTVSNVRAFLRDCSNGEVASGNAGAGLLPQLTTTPMGDLQAYDSNGNLLWHSSLPSVPSSLVYALTGNSIQTIHPQLPPRLPSQYVPLSLSNYKGTPFELGLPHVTKTLALPAPVDSHHDPTRRSIWYWIATICICATAAIWGLVILKYQNWRLSMPHHHPPSTPTNTSSSSMPRSASTQRLQAEHEQLQKQFRELQEQQQQFQQERQRSNSWAQLPLLTPLPPPVSAEPSNALSRYRTDFDEKERLGEGGFGTVFRAVNKLDGVQYAIKKVCLSTGNSKENERVLREVRHLAALDHPNIIRYYQSWMEEDEWNGSTNGSLAGGGEEGEDEESSHYDEDDMESEGDADSAGSEDEGVDSEGDYEGDESKAGSTTSQGDDESNTSRDSGFDKSAIKRLDFSKSGLVYDLDSSLDASHALSPKQTPRGKCGKRGEKRENRGAGGLDITFERTYGSTSTSMSAVTAGARRSGTSTPCRRNILYIQMQYCHQGTLQHWLNRADRVICPHEAIAIFRQAVRGVAHIHSNFVIHRDLKPPNILISADGSVKIGDFGLATGAIDGGPLSPMRILTRSHTAGVGSPLYCSPEQIKGDRYDSKVDIFSLGIILYEMFHIFSTQMERVGHITQLREGRINNETQELYPQLAELALSLVQANPDHRPPASEILTNSFISNSP